jgi:hypothetical protein
MRTISHHFLGGMEAGSLKEDVMGALPLGGSEPPPSRLILALITKSGNCKSNRVRRLEISVGNAGRTVGMQTSIPEHNGVGCFVIYR